MNTLYVTSPDTYLSLDGETVAVLRDDVELHFKDFIDNCANIQTFEKSHGRIEKREYFLETDIDWLFQKENWKNLNAIGAVKSTVDEKGVMHTEMRFFITSLTKIEDFARAVRGHWVIENQLHWCLDAIFREDASRARKDNSPLNLNVMRMLCEKPRYRCLKPPIWAESA